METSACICGICTFDSERIYASSWASTDEYHLFSFISSLTEINWSFALESLDSCQKISCTSIDMHTVIYVAAHMAIYTVETLCGNFFALVTREESALAREVFPVPGVPDMRTLGRPGRPQTRACSETVNSKVLDAYMCVYVTKLCMKPIH